MAGIESSYPTPVQGVSTLAPRNRARGQAGLQVNMRSDPVRKLTRRPSLEWTQYLATAGTTLTQHNYRRKGRDFDIVIVDGQPLCFVDGVQKTVDGDISAYLDSTDVICETVLDTTFVVNRDKVVEVEATPEDTSYSSLVSVVSALNYSTTLTVTGTATESGVDYSFEVEHEIPNGVSSLASADTKRATNYVAASIADSINEDSATHHMYAKSLGSSVAVWTKKRQASPLLVISAGTSDSVLAINDTISDVTGLPLYALSGKRVTVQPDPASTDGTYYLRALNLEGEATDTMEEVVWVESHIISGDDALVEETMPQIIRYDYENDNFYAGPPTEGWTARKTGDDDSCPIPDFVGSTIAAISYFQKRLVVLSDNNVSMSRTDDIFDWFRNSAVDLVTTDPIGISSNSTGIDTLQHVIEHNRDLLIVASNGQFKLDGTAAATPTTVALPLTTTQDIQVTVPPVSLSTDVFLPINYGDSTGMLRYSGIRDQTDATESITDHVIGYMKGSITNLVSSANLNMLVLTTSDSPANELYVYEQFTQGNKTLQQSWSRWVLPEDDEVLTLSFTESALVVYVRSVDGYIVKKTVNMYNAIAATENVYLDDLVVLSVDDDGTVVGPEYYDFTDCVVVTGTGATIELVDVSYTDITSDVTTPTIQLSNWRSAEEVYVGRLFKSRYRPTRPYVEDAQGVAVTSDKLRVSHFILNVVDTDSVKLHIDSVYYETEDQENTPRIVGDYFNRIGQIGVYTGDYRFSYAQDADLAEAEFYTEGYLGMTIAGISWRGQYRKARGRL